MSLISTHINLTRKRSCNKHLLRPDRSLLHPYRYLGKHSGRPVCTVTSRLEHSILNTNRCHHLTSTFETPRTWCTLQHLLLDTRRNSQVSPSTRHTRLFHPLPIRHRVMAVQASSSCALLLESSNPSNPPVQTEDKAFPPSPGSPHLAPSPLMCTSHRTVLSMAVSSSMFVVFPARRSAILVVK